MTACKDSLNGKKAVSATLAGVLAVGMVPAAAFAATDAQAADTQDEQGIELQAATAQDDFLAGTISEVTSGGKVVSDIDSITIKLAELSTKAPVITKLTNDSGIEKSLSEIGGLKQVYLTSANKGDNGAHLINGAYYTVSDTDTATKAGTRTVAVVKSANAYDDVNGINVPTLTFTVTADSLAGAYVTTATTVGSETTYPEKDLAYDGVTNYGQLVLSVDGKTAAKTYSKDTTDVKLFKDGVAVTPENTDKLAAGSYTAVATGADGKEVKVNFTVAKMDLATAGLNFGTKSQLTGSAATAPAFNDIKLADGTTAFTGMEANFTYVGATDTGTKGSYTVTITPKAGTADAANMEGTASITYDRVAGTKTLAYTYDGKAVASPLTLAVNRGFKADDVANGKLKSDFDASKLAATYDDTHTGEKATLDSSDLQVKIVKDGKEVDSCTEKGTYTVTVKADTAQNGYEFSSNELTINLTVTEGTVLDAGTTIKYNGEVATSETVTYDGEDALEPLSIVVKDSNGNTLAEGTDYKVEITKTKQADGTAEPNDPETGKKPVVSEAVNAGEYTVKVTSDVYTMDDETFTLTVAPIVLNNLALDNLFSYDVEKTTKSFVPYTGSVIDPVVKYVTTDPNNDNKEIKGTLPTDVYVASYQFTAKDAKTAKATTEILDEGAYTMTIKASDSEAAKNYKFASPADITIAPFTVEKKKVFADVATTDWFFSEVYKAQDNSYVKGIGGTELYAPYASMTRGDVCVVLLRMAGGDLDYNQDGSVNTTKGYNTKFSDVDPHAYYAKAIQWAFNAGIVTGFDGTDEFAPEQSVTRDQFATMLARYAKATGADIDADASAIDGYADASAVESWATPYVAWAVEAGVMGQNTDVLSPVKEVSRAEVAAMAVRYQPKAITTDLIK